MILQYWSEFPAKRGNEKLLQKVGLLVCQGKKEIINTGIWGKGLIESCII